jgi:hypothetical protein
MPFPFRLTQNIAHIHRSSLNETIDGILRDDPDAARSSDQPHGSTPPKRLTQYQKTLYMRGKDEQQLDVLSYISPEQRAPQDPSARFAAVSRGQALQRKHSPAHPDDLHR